MIFFILIYFQFSVNVNCYYNQKNFLKETLFYGLAYM